MRGKRGSSKPDTERPATEARRGEESDLAKKVRELMDKFEAEAAKGSIKMSVSDYVRLVQLRNEIESTERKDVVVTWLEKKPEELDSAV